MTNYTNLDVGRFGESYCAKYVKRVKKLKVIDQNVTIGKLEVDIIAANSTHIVFIEVKTRRQDKNNFFRPADAVDKSKRTNLINFAYTYCKSLPKKHTGKIPRIDVCEILVTVDKKLKVCDINYIENAVSKK